MRKLALALALAAAFGSTAVMAATTTTTTSSSSSAMASAPAAKPAVTPLSVTGKVASIDVKACTVTLDNKTTYHFGAHCKIGALKVGETVTISYKVKGKLDWVTKIVVAKV